MLMRAIIDRLDADRRQKLGELIRFGIVGVVATMLQYGIYLVCVRWMHVTIANTVGYGLSFMFNFWASTRYTFRVKANAKRGAGFVLSHGVNYLLQQAVLMGAVLMGVPERWAPLPMFAVCVPVNFLLVRFFLKR